MAQFFGGAGVNEHRKFDALDCMSHRVLRGAALVAKQLAQLQAEAAPREGRLAVPVSWELVRYPPVAVPGHPLGHFSRTKDRPRGLNIDSKCIQIDCGTETQRL